MLRSYLISQEFLSLAGNKNFLSSPLCEELKRTIAAMQNRKYGKRENIN